MVNRICLLLIVALIVRTGQAQVLGGVFDQGATELKEYAAQIAALGLYINKAKQGYTMVEKGLADIGNIHKAEFALHQAYFSSLAAVNPKIAGMSEVGEIVKLQAVIGQAGETDVDELADVLTPGKLVMTDDQRIARIEELDADIKRRYALVLEISARKEILMLQRKAAGVGAMQQLYGVH
jgi:hypothetical protein